MSPFDLVCICIMSFVSYICEKALDMDLACKDNTCTSIWW